MHFPDRGPIRDKSDAELFTVDLNGDENRTFHRLLCLWTLLNASGYASSQNLEDEKTPDFHSDTLATISCSRRVLKTRYTTLEALGNTTGEGTLAPDWKAETNRSSELDSGSH